MKNNKYSPYIIYKVEWTDILSCSDWLPSHKAKDEKPAQCVSIGFIAYQDKENTVISNEYSLTEDGFDIGNKTTIPNSNIINIKKISG
jgi:hypothetical protein